MRNTKYTYNLGKGIGLIDETLSLLSICDENSTKESLTEYVLQNNTLAKCTAKRSVDIVTLVFYPRFMKQNPKTTIWLKTIREKGLMLSQFKQLLFLYLARENAVVYDYVSNILFDLREDSYSRIPKDSTRKFIDNIVNEGKASWGEIASKKNASAIRAALVEFDILNRKGDILPYELSRFNMLYLMHELHFAGYSDVAIWNHEDWKLFGLDKYSIQERILEQNMRGGYIAQCTGELMDISWNYKTMEEFINAQL